MKSLFQVFLVFSKLYVFLIHWGITEAKSNLEKGKKPSNHILIVETATFRCLLFPMLFQCNFGSQKVLVVNDSIKCSENNVIVPGGSRPDPKEYLAFRCDLQFQSPVRAKPVGRL